MPRQGVLDPQGEAVRHGLGALGFDGVSRVRVGRVVEVELPEGVSREDALARGRSMATQLLANEVVEDFTVDVLDG
jgi:phosphoribosylformylglycinamidine synthase PurS subunit